MREHTHHPNDQINNLKITRSVLTVSTAGATAGTQSQDKESIGSNSSLLTTELDAFFQNEEDVIMKKLDTILPPDGEEENDERVPSDIENENHSIAQTRQDKFRVTILNRSSYDSLESLSNQSLCDPAPIIYRRSTHACSRDSQYAEKGRRPQDSHLSLEQHENNTKPLENHEPPEHLSVDSLEEEHLYQSSLDSPCVSETKPSHRRKSSLTQDGKSDNRLEPTPEMEPLYSNDTTTSDITEEESKEYPGHRSQSDGDRSIQSDPYPITRLNPFIQNGFHSGSRSLRSLPSSPTKKKRSIRARGSSSSSSGFFAPQNVLSRLSQRSQSWPSIPGPEYESSESTHQSDVGPSRRTDKSASSGHLSDLGPSRHRELSWGLSETKESFSSSSNKTGPNDSGIWQHDTSWLHQEKGVDNSFSQPLSSSSLEPLNDKRGLDSMSHDSFTNGDLVKKKSKDLEDESEDPDSEAFLSTPGQRHVKKNIKRAKKEALTLQTPIPEEGQEPAKVILRKIVTVEKVQPPFKIDETPGEPSMHFQEEILKKGKLPINLQFNYRVLFVFLIFGCALINLNLGFGLLFAYPSTLQTFDDTGNFYFLSKNERLLEDKKKINVQEKHNIVSENDNKRQLSVYNNNEDILSDDHNHDDYTSWEKDE